MFVVLIGVDVWIVAFVEEMLVATVAVVEDDRLVVLSEDTITALFVEVSVIVDAGVVVDTLELMGEIVDETTDGLSPAETVADEVALDVPLCVDVAVALDFETSATVVAVGLECASEAVPVFVLIEPLVALLREVVDLLDAADTVVLVEVLPVVLLMVLPVALFVGPVFVCTAEIDVWVESVVFCAEQMQQPRVRMMLRSSLKLVEVIS